jgi:hypothetical protein
MRRGTLQVLTGSQKIVLGRFCANANVALDDLFYDEGSKNLLD